jgi:hypothetical protein
MKNKPLAVGVIILALVGATGLVLMKSMKDSGEPEVSETAVAKPIEPKTFEQKTQPQTIVSATSNRVEVPVAAKPIAPSFDTVRVETSGDAVIAGRAEPNTEIVAKLNGTVVAATTTTADGSFVMIPAKPLPQGAGMLSLETKSKGEIQVSEATVAVAVKAQEQIPATVAVIAPDQPTMVLQAPKPTSSVVLDAVDYDPTGNIIFTGRAGPNAVVRLYIDNVIAGEIKSDSDGKWSFAGTTSVLPGNHSLRADEITRDGSVGSRVELPFLREEPAKVAEAVAPTPTPTSTAAVAVAVVPAVVVPKPTEPTRIVVQPGNNLWRLSRQIYGAGSRYTVIYEANKSQIRNPRLIYPGQIITAPLAETKSP